MSDFKSESVSSLFDKGLSFYHELCSTLEPSNNSSYQVTIWLSVDFLLDDYYNEAFISVGQGEGFYSHFGGSNSDG